VRAYVFAFLNTEESNKDFRREGVFS
jgi:hypothetical protein